MKRFITFLIIVIGAFSVNAIVPPTENITLTLTQEDSEPDKKDKPDKGYRSAPAPVICVINFSESTIEISTPGDITLYEIWDEDGETPIASYTDEEYMIEHLSYLTGVYQLRFITDTYKYVGYINL